MIAAILAILALISGLAWRARGQRASALFAQSLTDDMVRQIEEAGYVDLDEPLDLEEIQEEEERFWEEAPWEDPDEF